jgi:hypothetical protein
MRFFATALLFMIAASGAQAQDTQASAPRPVVTTPPPATEVVPDDRARPLASSNQTGRIVSKNEAYNLGRAAEGRLGVRLGNDMSYRVTGN